LSRPIPKEDEAVHLFSKNLDADFYNMKILQQLPGILKSFTSNDEGSQHYLNKIVAPKHLAIKETCSVTLLTNLSDDLV
jgi:hypothetical protein